MAETEIPRNRSGEDRICPGDLRLFMWTAVKVRVCMETGRIRLPEEPDAGAR